MAQNVFHNFDLVAKLFGLVDGAFEMKLQCTRQHQLDIGMVSNIEASDVIQLNTSIMVLCSRLTSTHPLSAINKSL